MTTFGEERPWVRTAGLGAVMALLALGGVGCDEAEPAGTPGAVSRRGAGALGEGGPRTELTSDGLEVVSGELLVRFKAGTGRASALQTHALVGAQVRHTFQSVDGLQLVSVPEGRSLEELVEAYRADPDVAYAEPNYLYRTQTLPDDSEFDELWGLHNVGQNGGTADADINAPEAWELTTGSEDVVIAVIDTGINYQHEDLADNVWTNPGEVPDNDLDDDGNGYVDDVHGINAISDNGNPLDDHKHGSHCAGTITGRGNNGRGVVGVGWKTKVLGCKFLSSSGSGTTANAVKCLDYLLALRTRAEKPVNLVATSNSWGGGAASQALQDAIARHRDEGILFVAAAGNDNKDSDVTPSYPASYPLSNIISVAATDRNDNRASFSNWGRRRVHVGAPGVDILSTVLGQGYSLLSGTSMATPHVSGLVGLLAAQDPSRDWRALKNLVIAGGQDTPAMTGKTLSGKRIRAADANGLGSLTCVDKVVTSRLLPMADNLQLIRGSRVELSALHINCANPAGDVVVNVTPGNSTLTLTDDGQGKDQVAGDGLYATEWEPPGAGSYTLTFPNGEVLTLMVLDVYRPARTVPFAWRTLTGTSLDLAENTVAEVVTPFPVRYGNHTGFSSAWVSSEGYLSFTDNRMNSSNAKLPVTSFQTLVAPFWDNLYTATAPPGHVYHEVQGTAPNREWIIEWRDIGNYSRRTDVPYPTATFQVVFKEGSPEVLFNYKDVDFRDGTDTYDRGGSATVGLQVNTTTATSFSYNTRSLSNGLSLVWSINAPPVLSDITATPTETTEGKSIDFSATFADADGLTDADWTVEWDFNHNGTTFKVDASAMLSSEGATNTTRLFPQSGRFVVGLRVKDKDGALSAVRTMVLNVANVLPEATGLAVSPTGGREGQPVRFTASFSDVGSADSPWLVEWDFDYDSSKDFKSERAQSLGAQGGISLEHVFRKDGVYTVGMRVVDKDGGASAIQTLSISIEDIQPRLSALSAPANALEGERLTLASSFGDPGDAASPWRVQWDFDYDGARFDVDQEQLHTVPGAVSLARAFADDGVRVIAARLVDMDGSISEVETWTLDVRDVSPNIREALATPLSGDEPRTVEFQLTTTSGSPDPETDPVRYYHWDFDGDGLVDHLGAEPRAVFRYLDNPRGGDTWQASVWVEDEDSRTRHVFPIVIANQPPALAEVAPTSAAVEGSVFRLWLRATDPAGPMDPLSWHLTEGPEGMMLDGTGVLLWVPAFEQTVGGTGAAHTVTIVVGDDDGATDSVTFTVRAAWKDGDDDGMPDTWERARGMDPTRDDSAEDLDGDGVSNRDESLATNQGTHLPGAVRAHGPLSGAHVRVAGLSLVVDNVTPRAGVTFTYQFALYKDEALTQQMLTTTVPQGASGRTSGTVDGAALADDTTYWWRARAFDGERYGPWSAAQRIVYNPINGVPSAPLAISPAHGLRISEDRPLLSVLNAKDPEGDTLTYELEVRAGDVNGQVVASAQSVVEGGSGTHFTVPEKLANGPYIWRARAVDREGSPGAWSEPAAFVVEASGAGCSAAAGGASTWGMLPMLLMMLGLGLRRRR